MGKNFQFGQALPWSGLFCFRQFVAFPTSLPVKQTSQSRFATAHLIAPTKKLRKSVALLSCFIVRSVARGSDTSNFRITSAAFCEIKDFSKFSLELSTSCIRRHNLCKMLHESAFRRSMMKFMTFQHYGRFAYDSAACSPITKVLGNSYRYSAWTF